MHVQVPIPLKTWLFRLDSKSYYKLRLKIVREFLQKCLFFKLQIFAGTVYQIIHICHPKIKACSGNICTRGCLCFLLKTQICFCLTRVSSDSTALSMSYFGSKLSENSCKNACFIIKKKLLQLVTFA